MKNLNRITKMECIGESLRLCRQAKRLLRLSGVLGGIADKSLAYREKLMDDDKFQTVRFSLVVTISDGAVGGMAKATEMSKYCYDSAERYTRVAEGLEKLERVRA